MRHKQRALASCAWVVEAITLLLIKHQQFLIWKFQSAFIAWHYLSRHCGKKPNHKTSASFLRQNSKILNSVNSSAINTVFKNIQKSKNEPCNKTQQQNKVSKILAVPSFLGMTALFVFLLQIGCTIKFNCNSLQLVPLVREQCNAKSGNNPRLRRIKSRAPFCFCCLPRWAKHLRGKSKKKRKKQQHL